MIQYSPALTLRVLLSESRKNHATPITFFPFLLAPPFISILFSSNKKQRSLLLPLCAFVGSFVLYPTFFSVVGFTQKREETSGFFPLYSIHFHTWDDPPLLCSSFSIHNTLHPFVCLLFLWIITDRRRSLCCCDTSIISSISLSVVLGQEEIYARYIRSNIFCRQYDYESYSYNATISTATIQCTSNDS